MEWNLINPYRKFNKKNLQSEKIKPTFLKRKKVSVMEDGIATPETEFVITKEKVEQQEKKNG